MTAQQPFELLVERADTPTAGPAPCFAGREIARRWAECPPADVAHQLQNLVQAYGFFLDFGQHAELASLFSAEAVWDGSDHGFGIARGPEAIASVVVRPLDPASPLMHLAGPALLTKVSDDEVHGICWGMATRWAEGSPKPMLYFYYEDIFRRYGDGEWRFARRRVRPRCVSA